MREKKNLLNYCGIFGIATVSDEIGRAGLHRI